MFAEGNWAKKCSSVLFTYFFWEFWTISLFFIFVLELQKKKKKHKQT